MASKTTVVRILVDTPIGSKSYKPNTLVSLPARVAATLVKAGVADDTDEAIIYCRSTGVEIVEHADDAAADGNAGGDGADQTGDQ